MSTQYCVVQAPKVGDIYPPPTHTHTYTSVAPTIQAMTAILLASHHCRRSYRNVPYWSRVRRQSVGDQMFTGSRKLKAALCPVIANGCRAIRRSLVTGGQLHACETRIYHQSYSQLRCIVALRLGTPLSCTITASMSLCTSVCLSVCVCPWSRPTFAVPLICISTGLCQYNPCYI